MKLDAICLEQCDYSEHKISKELTYISVAKYAVYEEKVKEIDIFKLDNKQEVPIFVSDRFVKVIKNNKLSGMEFLEIDVI